MIRPPTPRQMDALRAIAAHIAANGYPPTLGEVCEAMHITTKSTALQHVRDLRRKGCLDTPRRRNTARGYALTEYGRLLVARATS